MNKAWHIIVGSSRLPRGWGIEVQGWQGKGAGMRSQPGNCLGQLGCHGRQWGLSRAVGEEATGTRGSSPPLV